MSMISTRLLRPRPQELGKIKIGQKGQLRTSQGGKEFRLPQKLDHFIVTTRHRGDDENFVRDEAIHAKIGDRPTRLRGILMYPTIEENFHAEMTQYRGQEKVWSCNGEEATNLKTGACAACPRVTGTECKCKPYMRLLVQLWDAPVLGYHVFRSTGWETTNNIQSALKEIYEQFGTLYRAPIELVLYPATVKYKEGTQEKTSDAFMVGLTLAMSMDDVAREMVNAKRLMEATRQELRLLSAGVQAEQTEREQEEARDIAEEFFPEAAVQTSVATQERLEGFKQQHAPVQDADYEVVEDGAGSNGASAATATATVLTTAQRRKLDARYHAMLQQLRPDLASADVARHIWQEAVTGKASSKEWGQEDFELAMLMLERGGGPDEEQVQAIADAED